MVENGGKGVIYREGLRALKERCGSLDAAFEAAMADFKQSGSDEHIEPTKEAYEQLKTEED
jgi:hypothetical protein